MSSVSLVVCAGGSQGVHVRNPADLGLPLPRHQCPAWAVPAHGTHLAPHSTLASEAAKARPVMAPYLRPGVCSSAARRSRSA